MKARNSSKCPAVKLARAHKMTGPYGGRLYQCSTGNHWFIVIACNRMLGIERNNEWVMPDGFKVTQAPNIVHALTESDYAMS